MNGREVAWSSPAAIAPRVPVMERNRTSPSVDGITKAIAMTTARLSKDTGGMAPPLTRCGGTVRVRRRSLRIAMASGAAA